MQYQARVKFSAALAANGDIVPGAAVTGFLASALDASDYGVYCCLLEDPATNNWELCRYDATQATGSRRGVLFGSGGASSAGGLAAPLTGLTCSLVAHPNAYVLSTHGYLADTPALVRSVDCTGVGARPDIGTGSPNSIALNGTVLDDSPHSLSVGGAAGSPETVALGIGALAQGYFDPDSYETISTRGSVALGHQAQTTAAGEVALGSALASHASGLPVMTNDPSAGGTFLFRAVGGYDGGTSSSILSDINSANTYCPSDGGSGPQWVFHVQGTIVARATDPANDKVVKVEWVTGGTLTQTVLTQGANNTSLGLALDGMRLQATVGAVAGLKLAGYLHLTKVALPV